jgi:hypothetical protein
MTKRRLTPPPPTSVPAKKPASSISAVKPRSTLESMRAKLQRPKPPSVLFIDDEEAIIAT